MKCFRVLLAAASLVVACSASAQELGDVSREAMKQLSWMVGKWRGEGKTIQGPGKEQHATVTEEIVSKLNGMLFVIDGLGKSKEKPDETVHHAFAVLGYDPVAKKFTMRPYLVNGLTVDARIDVKDGNIVWGFDIPDVGEVRYTIRRTEQGQWNEVGEISRDKGAEWFKFFEMTLDKSKE